MFKTDGLKDLKGARIALVHTEWNDQIVTEQINGCLRVMHQFDATIVDSVAVPGSFEIPYGCKRIWEHYSSQDASLQPEAIIAFGAVIRGGTPHFEYVCKAVTEGITQLNLTLPVPVIFGILTLDTDEQAWERLGGIHGHKGEEAALTALKMISLCRNKAVKN